MNGPDITPTSAPGRTVLCPGTYDPVTFGHIDVIARAARLFDRVVVGVVRSPKHKDVLFDLAERRELITESVRDLPNVVVAGFSSLVVEYAREWGACALVKGLRAVSDYEWEFQMSHLNKLQAPEIDTVYLMSSPQYSFVSSSGVRELASFGGRLDELVPPHVASALNRRRREKAGE
jgi:pantetheine-phosphate adenylyltransferase